MVILGICGVAALLSFLMIFANKWMDHSVGSGLGKRNRERLGIEDEKKTQEYHE